MILYLIKEILKLTTNNNILITKSNKSSQILIIAKCYHWKGH